MALGAPARRDGDRVASRRMIRITTLAERPHLEQELWAVTGAMWPEFMRHDANAGLYYNRCATVWPDLVLVATDGDAVVARAFAVPFAFSEPLAPERTTLPTDGWDQVIRWAAQDLLDGRPANLMSALEISVLPDYRGRGLSAKLLAGLRECARRAGAVALVAPVRPSEKHLQPHVPMWAYVEQLRPDGLPQDPWLRVHVRAGGRIDSIAPTSMSITAPLVDWRLWTGLPFDRDGDVMVDGALSPVRCCMVDEIAIYIEANVWVVHDLGEPDS